MRDSSRSCTSTRTEAPAGGRVTRTRASNGWPSSSHVDWSTSSMRASPGTCGGAAGAERAGMSGAPGAAGEAPAAPVPTGPTTAASAPAARPSAAGQERGLMARPRPAARSGR
jgi:hypothetical protein